MFEGLCIDVCVCVCFTCMQMVDPRTCKGSNSLQRVSGSLSMVEVATDGSVYGVNRQGQVFRRYCHS